MDQEKEWVSKGNRQCQIRHRILLHGGAGLGSLGNHRNPSDNGKRKYFVGPGQKAGNVIHDWKPLCFTCEMRRESTGSRQNSPDPPGIIVPTGTGSPPSFFFLRWPPGRVTGTQCPKSIEIGTSTGSGAEIPADLNAGERI